MKCEMGTGYGNPRVSTKCSQKLAKFCNRFNVAKNLVVLIISAFVILPQEVGCGQNMNASLFHTSSFRTQIHPQPTKTVLDSQDAQAGKYFPHDRPTFSVNVRHDGNDNDKEFAGRRKRQILQPSPERKKKTFEITEMMDIYIDFIADISIFRGWSAVIIILPGNGQLCEYASVMLARTRASLRSECVADEDFRISVSTTTTNTPSLDSSNPLLSMPVFSFYFLRPINTTTSPLHPTLLTPIRPAFVLGNNLLNKDILLLNQVRPVGISNCIKWTMIWPEGLNTLMVEDVYGFPGAGVAPITQVIGQWSPDEGLHIDQELALGPSDFMGRTLRITTVAGPPLVFVTKTSNGKTKCTGYLPDIIKIISLQLNFTYEYIVPQDSKFGGVEPNGSWSGMVGMLQRLEAEIAMMSFSLTASRKTVMDFSPPVEYSSVRLLIRRDWQNSELKWSAYLRPLGGDVWVIIPIFVCLGVITLAIFSYYKILDISPLTSAWLLTSCFILQGQDEHSVIKVTPYRLVLGTFWILSVVVFACYTARLTAFLAASNEILPVSDLSQAVKNRNWKVGLVKGSAFIDRIKESRVDVLRRLYQRISEDASSLVDTFQEGMEKVFKERYIFFTSELIPAFLIRSNCSYTWLPDKYFSGFGYMGYQRFLPFAPIISQRVAEIRQTGQMKRLFQKWWGTESVCFTNSGESFLGMSLYETGTAFLILLLGASLSITFILVEFCSRTRNIFRKKTAKPSKASAMKTLSNSAVPVINDSRTDNTFSKYSKKSLFSF